MTNEELWQAALGELELSLSKANFTTWFKNTAVSSYENSTAIISVPNNFTRSWLEQKYNEDIKKTLRKITGQPIVTIIYKIEPRYSSFVRLPETTIATETQFCPEQERIMGPQNDGLNKHGLNPKYVFDTFIVGKGNELAHAACQASAARPGRAYNPLYLYGGVGLGKTHLLHAVGHELMKNNDETKIIYVTCEKFTNDFIHSVRYKKMDEFRKKYRDADLLLVDDIQFITGKEGTQEEFFHTFNALHQSNRQIIITADRPPKGIPDLEQRLLSRFEWGMTADLSAPDLETRIAILEAKCQEKRYELDRRILQYIALNIQNNVRELEGVLTKIIAFHQLKNNIPSFETIKNIVSGFSSTKTRKNITMKHLIDAICDFYNIEIEDIMGKTREQRIALPRQILMFLMRDEMKQSFPSIGRELGGRDHTTIMHAHKKIVRESENNIQLKQELETIKQNIYNSTLPQ